MARKYTPESYALLRLRQMQKAGLIGSVNQLRNLNPEMDMAGLWRMLSGMGLSNRAAQQGGTPDAGAWLRGGAQGVGPGMPEQMDQQGGFLPMGQQSGGNFPATSPYQDQRADLANFVVKRNQGRGNLRMLM